MNRSTNTAAVLEGAKCLLSAMYATPCINGTGYYPNEIRAQERRVAELEAKMAKESKS